MKDPSHEPALTLPRTFGDEVAASFTALGSTGLASVPYGLAYSVIQIGVVLAVCGGVAGGLVLLVLTGGLGTLALLVAALVLAPLVAAITAWLHLGLLAAQLDYLRDGTGQGLFAGLRQPAPMGLFLFLIGYQLALGLGTVLLYLPAVFVEAAFHGVAPAVLMNDLPLGPAIAQSWARFRARPLEAMGYTLLDNLLAIAVMSALPVLGGVLAAHLSHQLQARAYLANRKTP